MKTQPKQLRQPKQITIRSGRTFRLGQRVRAEGRTFATGRITRLVPACNGRRAYAWLRLDEPMLTWFGGPGSTMHAQEFLSECRILCGKGGAR